MREDIKKQWIEALRSGDYYQTRGTLHRLVESDADGSFTREGYCCLGVLCELAVGEDVITTQKVPGMARMEYVDPGTGRSEQALLPYPVRSWAGLSEHGSGVVVEVDGVTHSLATLNDSGHTFAAIADLIEEKL